MSKSVFCKNSNQWVKLLSKRTLDEFIDTDFAFALSIHNTDAVRACVGCLNRLEGKNKIDDNHRQKIASLLQCAIGFSPQQWFSVLLIFNLYDKSNSNLGEQWVENTPDVADKMQNVLNNKPHTPKDKIKKLTIVMSHALKTSRIEQFVISRSAEERCDMVKQYLDPLSLVSAFRPSQKSQWDADLASRLAGCFSEFTQAVFLRIAASAIALDGVEKLYTDPNISRPEFYKRLEQCGNEGLSSQLLSFMMLDSSMKMEHQKNNALEDLEKIVTSVPAAEQEKYIQLLVGSPYIDIIKQSVVLKNIVQKIVLEQNLVYPTEERLRKI